MPGLNLPAAHVPKSLLRCPYCFLCSYAAELVAREEAALGLVREMLGYEGREAARDAAAAEQRLAAARLDAADADAELARAQAEGPASHRKRDYIDKVSASPYIEDVPASL